MFAPRSILLAGIASLAGAQALSTTCTAQVASFALGDVGNCLAITSLLPLLSSTAFTSSLNTYLTSLCGSSTPVCSNATLTSALGSLNSSCSSDISSGGSDATEVEALQAILEYYPQVHAAGCAKNSTTGDLCLIGTLNSVQNITGTNITVDFLTGLLSGDDSVVGELESALTSGQLCTGCVQTIYGEAVSANASIANTTIGQGLTSQCGANFASASSATGVSAASTAAATSATSSSASASSAAKGGATSFVPMPLILAGGAIMAAMAVGGRLVL